NLTASSSMGAEVISLGDNVFLRLDRSASSRGLEGGFWDGTTWRVTSSGVYLAGEGWNHVAYTYDSVAQVQRIHLNGVVVAETAYSEAIVYGKGVNTTIGTNGNGVAGFDFNGLIDDARVYSRAMSSNELAALAADRADTTDTVTITVNSVNDAPSFDSHAGTVSFDPAANFIAGNAVHELGSGKFLVAGTVDGGATGLDFAVARYNADGTLDTTFGTAGLVTTDFTSSDDRALGITVDPTGKIVVVGYWNGGAYDDIAVARYNSDGSLDSSFGSGGTVIHNIGFNDGADEVTIDDEGRIVLVGWRGNGGNADIVTVRLNTDGSLDTTFNGTGWVKDTFGMADGASGAQYGHGILTDANQKIIVSGYGYTGSSKDLILLRYNVDGTLDTSFGTSGRFSLDVNSLSAEADGKLVLDDAGNILIVGTDTTNGEIALARVTSAGVLDATFGSGGVVTTSGLTGEFTGIDLKLQADGKIIVVGTINDGADDDFAVLRFNTNGTLDTSFSGDGLATYDGGFADTLSGVFVTDAGQIVAVGTSNDGTQDRATVIRFNSDGSLDTNYFSPRNSLDGNPTFVEGGPAVILDSDVEVFDQELTSANNFDGASLTIARDGGASSDDVLSFNDGNGITRSGGNLLKNSQIIATFDSTSTAGTLVITFTDANGETPTSTDVDNILRQITYANSSDTPPASVQLNWTFDDGNTGSQGSDGALQATGSTIVNITATNDAPGRGVDRGTPLAYAENDGAVAITSTLTITDVDDTHIESAVVQITGNYASGEDLLAFVDQNGISGVWNATNGTLTLSGSATLASTKPRFAALLSRTLATVPPPPREPSASRSTMETTTPTR
ncbi:MAG: LamG-like jellyroll fold domain-containing protein, partial [Pirellulaceae bacterium]